MVSPSFYKAVCARIQVQHGSWNARTYTNKRFHPQTNELESLDPTLSSFPRSFAFPFTTRPRDRYTDKRTRSYDATLIRSRARISPLPSASEIKICFTEEGGEGEGEGEGRCSIKKFLKPRKFLKRVCNNNNGIFLITKNLITRRLRAHV